MHCPVRRVFWTCCLATCVLTLMFYFHRTEDRLQEIRRQDLNIATDTITALDNRTFIIAPYYDPRGRPSVRVLSIIHVSVKELYCLFHCSHNQPITVRGEIDLHSDRFGFPYGTADILCAEPLECDYNYISVHSSNSTNMSPILKFNIKNRPTQSFSSNFTVCISAIYGHYNNVLQMIQSIEMYKLLGASRVTIYNNSCSHNVDKVLRHYIHEGVVEVVPWPIDHHLLTSTEWQHAKGLTSQIGYYGQTAALNDCLYKNMYKSKFVLLNDIDEIILPVRHWDWSSLMENLQERFPDTSVFRVENHVFPIAANGSGFNLWTHVPGVNILRHSFRQPINRNIYNGRKMIVNPRQIFQTSIHSALKYTGTSRDLPQDMAITFHGKNRKLSDAALKGLIEDNILQDYNMSLVPIVDKVIEQLFPQH